MATKKKGKDKVVNDNIHGLIELTPLIQKIIDTPEFQRMRNISQLGGTQFVYPTAAHRRFEHCIGTYHLAGKLLDKLKHHQPELDITKEDDMCVRIAALCHDLGHGPFSHLWDNKFMPRRGKKVNHEDRSAFMIDRILDKNDGELRKYFTDEGLEEKDIQFIKDLIQGTATNEKTCVRWKNKMYLYEIVSNNFSKIDVDKWDYLARDANGLGSFVANATFTFDRYIHYIRVVTHGKTGERHLGLRDKEYHSLFSVFQLRHQLHRIAYQHKVTVAIQEMLCDTFLAADEYLKLSEKTKDMQEFSQLTDSLFWEILHSKHEELAESRQILERIVSRRLYRLVGTWTVEADRKTIPAEMEILKELGKMDERIDDKVACVAITEFNFGGKGNNPLKSLYLWDKDFNVTSTFADDFAASRMFKPVIFSEKEVRVYAKTEDQDLRDVINETFEEWTKKQTRSVEIPVFCQVEYVQGSSGTLIVEDKNSYVVVPSNSSVAELIANSMKLLGYPESDIRRAEGFLQVENWDEPIPLRVVCKEPEKRTVHEVLSHITNHVRLLIRIRLLNASSATRSLSA